ncbi:MAG: hypothetical protein C0427_14570 [Rhodobacter sp.]|nr:hypothetical protein [Rhodobacter sp.]
MKTVQQVLIFLSSPGELVQERDLVVAVCDEINLDSGAREGFHLQVIRWETHAFPTASERSQQAINLQIGDDYDIFLGLMGTRFGSSTGKYGSGTQEEFEEAHERYVQSGSPEIMFYFFGGTTEFSSLDLDQIRNREDFRKSVQDRGILTWTYKNSIELRSYLHRHIQLTVRKLLQKKELAEGPTDASYVQTETSAFDPLTSWNRLVSTDADIALTELAHSLTSDMNTATGSLSDLNRIVSDLGRRIKRASEKLSRSSGTEAQRMTTFVKVMEDVVKDLQKYESQLRRLIPQVYHPLEAAFSNLERMKNISSSTSTHSELVNGLRNQVMEAFASEVPAVVEKVVEFRNSIENWPDFPMLAQQKKRLKALHNDLIGMLSQVAEFARKLS